MVALLDSGADVSVLPKGVAELLGIDLKGSKEEVVGVGGKVEAVETNVSIVVSGAHEKYAFRIIVNPQKNPDMFVGSQIAHKEIISRLFPCRAIK